MSDLRQKIFDANDMVMEKVHVDEWDIDVYLKRLSCKERDCYEASLYQEINSKLETTLHNARTKLLMATVCDERGELIFDEADFEKLAGKSASAVDKLYAVAERMSGLSKSQVEMLQEAQETTLFGPIHNSPDGLIGPDTAQPTVSIIVPVYNAGPYLKECLDSILAQTFTNFELLLINDGSVDQSPRICDEYAYRDQRIIVIHKENEGPSATRNLGLRKASGEYIVFCDADDVMAPKALELLYSVMDKHQTDLGLCGFSRFSGSIHKQLEKRTLSKYSVTILQSTKELASLYFQPATNMFGISIWAKMYRTDIIRENSLMFPEDVNYEEDCCFNVAYFRHVTTTGIVRDILYHYRQQQASLSKGYRADAFIGIVNGYRNRRMFLADIGLESSVKRLDTTFLVAVNNNYKKIIVSSLSKAERLEAYRKMLDIPDVVQMAHSIGLSPNRLTRMLTLATRAQDPKQLDRVLNLWLTKGRIMRKIKAIPGRAKRMIKKILGR